MSNHRFSRTASGTLLPVCDPEIFSSGTHIATLTGSADQNEAVVVHTRLKGFRIDWHSFAGRGIVKTLDDPETVRKALDESFVELGWG